MARGASTSLDRSFSMILRKTWIEVSLIWIEPRLVLDVSMTWESQGGMSLKEVGSAYCWI